MNIKNVNNKYSKFLINKNGFTVIEVLVAMTILTLFIMAFSALFVQSYTGIIAAGDKNNASYDAQAEVEKRIAEENSDHEEKFTIKFGSIVLDIVGGAINAVSPSRNGKTTSLDAFLAYIPTINIETNTAEGFIAEGYPDDHIITVNGVNTHFDISNSTLVIKDRNGFDVTNRTLIGDITPSKIISVETDDSDESIQTMSISLTAGLKNSESPYLITIKTGDELVSSKLTVMPEIKYVSVGSARKIAVSHNVSGWTYDYYGSVNNLNCIAYYNGFYLAAGDQGKVEYSTNGYNWIKLDLNGSEPITNFKSIAYGAGKSVAVGSGGIVYTSLENVVDPDHPNSRQYLTLSSTTNLNGVTYGDGKFVTVGSGGFIKYLSPVEVLDWKDPSNWKSPSYSAVSSLVNLNAVAYGTICGENLYVAAGDNGTIAFSKDADTWYLGKFTEDINLSGINFNSVVVADGRIIVVGDNKIFTTSNVSVQYDETSTNVVESVNVTGLLNQVGVAVKSVIWANGKYWIIDEDSTSSYIRYSQYGGASWSDPIKIGDITGMNSLNIR